METLEALHSRNSVTSLSEPVPTPEEMKMVFQAALRAPDHAWLRPWKFIQVTGEGRKKLGDAFLRTATAVIGDLSEALVKKAKNAPLRAPMVLVLIADITEHPKVPEIEQIISTGAAAQNMLLALHDLGYAAVWRTGKMAFNSEITKQMELPESNRVIGYLYVGTPTGRVKEIPKLDMNKFVSFWD
jgi:nitroreductase